MKNEFILNHNILNILVILVFLFCYALIVLEEIIKINRTKTVILSAGIIWFSIALSVNTDQEIKIVKYFINNVLLEYCELFLFLFVAMVYINSMKFFDILDEIKYFILKYKLSYKKIYWITGLLAFFISPLADNLTTALLMCSVIKSIDQNNKNFINLTCINIVVASNAGGAFSPFGDITTLMIWQNHILPFSSFFKIFFPALISFLIPSIIMSFYIPNIHPEINCKIKTSFAIKNGAKIVIFLFILTIFITVFAQTYFNLPSVLGMMTGLGFLYLFEYMQKNKYAFIITDQINKVEWDTLLFFYGIMLCVCGLGAIGILNGISCYIYNGLDLGLDDIYKHAPANIIIGLLSAIIDNIPITFAVINMNPSMTEGQWLLVTFAVGVGGSLLSIGSAAGIALMGQVKSYTFIVHLKWSWAILIGYLLGIYLHIYMNNNLFKFILA